MYPKRRRDDEIAIEVVAKVASTCGEGLVSVDGWSLVAWDADEPTLLPLWASTMTSPLRSRVVEAGARAIANDRAEELDVWHFDDARAALDAMLDCLTENADEVNEQAIEIWRAQMGDIPFDGPLIAEFVTVLRNPDE